VELKNEVFWPSRPTATLSASLLPCHSGKGDGKALRFIEKVLVKF
jgi:hypothetical protein